MHGGQVGRWGLPGHPRLVPAVGQVDVNVLGYFVDYAHAHAMQAGNLAHGKASGSVCPYRLSTGRFQGSGVVSCWVHGVSNFWV